MTSSLPIGDLIQVKNPRHFQHWPALGEMGIVYKVELQTCLIKWIRTSDDYAGRSRGYWYIEDILNVFDVVA